MSQDLHGRIEDIIASGLIDTDFAEDEHHWKRGHQVQKTISLMELDGEPALKLVPQG
ncbi:MAG: hypothetical protein IPG44_06495 [Anaerolineales bacterium]|nr:hypothetical protein [Anaerolineales bacterium]